MDLPSGVIKHSWKIPCKWRFRAGKIIKQNGRLVLMTGEES